MGFPQSALTILNGIVQYGHLGIYRILESQKQKPFMFPPVQRPDTSHIRPDCNKLFLCGDQIFSQGIVKGEVKECFKHGFTYQDNHDWTIQSGVFSGKDGALIAIQLPRRIHINRVESSAFSVKKSPTVKAPPNTSSRGQVQVCIGQEVGFNSVRVCNLEMNSDWKCEARNTKVPTSAPIGNVIWIEVGPDTEVPYFIFGVDTQNHVNALLDRINDTPRPKPLGRMMCSEQPMTPSRKRNPRYTENPFATRIMKCSIDQIVYKEGLRFHPAFKDGESGESVFIDEELLRSMEDDTMSILKLADWPSSFYGKPEYVVNVAKEFVYRYAQNENVDKKSRPVDTKTKYRVFEENMTTNKQKVGLGLARGLHIDHVFGRSPFEFARAQHHLYTETKAIDNTFWIGMSVPADRDFIYFATQHMRTVLKKQCFDYVNIKITNYDDLWEIYTLFTLFHTYMETVPIFLELDFNFDWREYPSLLYICTQWNVSKVILNGYDDYVFRLGLGRDYLEFVKWMAVSKGFMVTKIHLFEQTIHAIGHDEETHKKTHVLSRAINVGDTTIIKYKGEELNMPLLCNGRNRPDGENNRRKRTPE